MVGLGRIERQLCDIQGRLFELSLIQRYDSPSFIKTFMNSQTSASLDDNYDRLQWAGEEYILEELNEEVGGLKKNGVLYSQEAMFWIGYTYRYWHYYKRQLSREIYRQADAARMNEVYMAFHTLDVEMAIDDLLEIDRQEKDKN